MSQCHIIRDQPMPVLRDWRPTGEYEAPTRLQRALDIAKWHRWGGEEHHTHARGRDIKDSRLEREHLSVPGMQGDIAQSAFGDLLPRSAEHRFRDVDRDDASVLTDCLGERQGQRPGATADLEHAFAA